MNTTDTTFSSEIGWFTMLYVPFSWLLVICGLVGNALCLWVFHYYQTKNAAKSSANLLMQVLAVADSGSLVFHLVCENVPRGIDVGLYPQPARPDIHKVVIFYLGAVKKFFQFMSTWIICAITVDR